MKLSAENPSQSTTLRRWPTLLTALAAAWVAWGAVRELLQAQASLSTVFSPLGQVFTRLANGQPAGAAAGRFVSKWGLTSVELLLMVAMLALGVWAGLAAARSPETPGRLARGIITARRRFPWAAALVATLIALYPAFVLLETYWGEAFAGPYLRLCLLLAAGLLAAAVLPLARPALIDLRAALLGVALVGSVFLIAGQLLTVNSYPFSLTWSEGNRLYEYSIPFIGDRYHYTGELTLLRGSVGRFWLWGLPFLIPEAPIWVHRLWNALLSTVPHLALGALLARGAGLSRLGRGLLALWVFLFLAQGPIYTPLILCALAVTALVRPGKLVQSSLVAAAAGYYASLSRWTWLPAVPAWTVFLLLADFDREAETAAGGWRGLFSTATLRRLLPVAIPALAGLAGGLLANPKLFQPVKLSQSTALAQPLLWYRLWPNATYAEGVLLALLIACVPAITLLVWLVWSGRWQPSRLQLLAYLAAGAVFLGGGIVASVKIGGGNNLHNLDMFLVTLALLVGLALQGMAKSSLQKEARAPGWGRSLPGGVQLVLVLAVLLPAWAAIRSGTPLKLPPAESTHKALENIRSQVTASAAQGEVLFIDQRQLLTFGQIEGVPLTPEYEKKYVMDQAMAGSADYFADFYRDLADQRFALIVSDMQFKLMKDSSYAFGEENNAWVQWVSQPLLCYYMPLRTLQNVDIQLLIPNPEAHSCPAP